MSHSLKHTADHPLLKRVEAALDAIRPYLEADNGNVRIVAIDPSNVVHVAFIGSCITCPSASMTLKNGIEQTIKEQVPEVPKVMAVELNE